MQRSNLRTLFRVQMTSEIAGVTQIIHQSCNAHAANPSRWKNPEKARYPDEPPNQSSILALLPLRVDLPQCRLNTVCPIAKREWLV